MKRNIFTGILIALLAGIVPIISCHKIDPRGGETTCSEDDLKPKMFKIISMATKTVLFHSNTLADTTIHYSHDSITKTIYIDDIVMSFNQRHTPSFSFVPEAVACSPAEPTTHQKITSLYIISKSTQTINPNYSVAAGDTLNDLFEATTFWYNQNFSPIQNILNPPYRYTPYIEFNLRLLPKPENPIVLTFDIKVTLSDGSDYYFENERLRVK